MKITLVNGSEIQTASSGDKCVMGIRPNDSHEIHCGNCPFLKTFKHKCMNRINHPMCQPFCALKGEPHYFLWKDKFSIFPSGYWETGYWETIRTEECCQLDPNSKVLEKRNNYIIHYGLGGMHRILLWEQKGLWSGGQING